ncbi:unnamed protein product [Hymenolepis diminuta]|uniref:Uncharacterized protein n=1 Tax=Hymenolepis diminuta TaxID=6216 RepID=A0A158QFP7_HYMDI|nr:unnamed protein product [Hymenolepis diminuta]
MKSISHKRLRFLPLPEIEPSFENPLLYRSEIFSSVLSRQLDSPAFLPPNLGSVSSSLQLSESLSDFNAIEPGPCFQSLTRIFKIEMPSVLNNDVDVPSTVDQMSIPERTPTPPPFLSPPISLSRRPTSVPLFNHSSELSHHCTNNSGLPRLGDGVSYILNSAPRLCETPNRSKIRIQSSIPGLQGRTRSLLAVAEAEERALRGRLDSLQSEMEKEVESEANEATISVNTSISETISQADSKLSSTINFYTTTTNNDNNEKMYPKSTVIGDDSLRVPSPPVLEEKLSLDDPNIPRQNKEDEEFPEPPSEILLPTLQSPGTMLNLIHQSGDQSELNIISVPKEENEETNHQIELRNTGNLVENWNKTAVDQTPQSPEFLSSSLTETSLSLKLSEPDTAVKRTLTGLLKEEFKQLKAAKETYKSKKKAIIELKTLLQLDSILPQPEELVPDAGPYISGELDRNSIPIDHQIGKILKLEDFKQSLSARVASAHPKKDPKSHQNSDNQPQEGLKPDHSDLEESAFL